MKKIKFLAMMLLATSVSMTTVSCGDDDSNDTEQGGGGTEQGGSSSDTSGGGNNDSSALSAGEQKSRLESTARELMGKVSASDFDFIDDITDALDGTNDEVLEDWADAALDACTLSSSKTYIKRLYQASNYGGEFELVGNKWTQIKKTTDYLKFTLTDKLGHKWVATITPSGKETKVHHDVFDIEDWNYDYTGGYWDYYDVTKENSFVVPATINVSLTKDGTSMAKSTVNTSITMANAPEFDVETDKVSATTETTVNGYTLKVTKANYSAGASGEGVATLTKNGETLLTVNANATGKASEDDAEVHTANLVVKILGGKVRLEGKIEKGKELQDYLEKADADDDNESAFKNYISKANELIDLKLYFDNSRNSTSYIQLLPVEEEEFGYMGYYTRWDAQPAVCFSDGTKYSFEDYFDEDTFDKVIKKWEDLIEDFTDLFE